MSEVVIDVEEFLERVQDDKELFFELFEIFVEDFEEKRKGLSQAVENKDYAQLRSIGHSLKGASGNISAKVLRNIAITLEDMGKNNEMTGVEEFLIKIDEAFKALTARIEELKTELA